MNARKLLMPLTTMLMLNAGAFAQTGHYCPSDAMNDTLLNNDPVFNRSFMYMEHVLQHRQSQDVSERSDDLYVLPVVVHVIHTGDPYGTGVNITDEQIFSAIEALNEDFRKIPGTNGDGAGADINIEFCLASRDPNGNSTNGIVRVNGSSVPSYATMGIEASGGNGAIEESVKALSTWPRQSYMNIWVVNEIENNDGGSGIQGYAYFPFNSPVDGIVVLFNAFGTVGNLKSYTNMNRVITHEVGHYLGLYHTFNGTSSCSSESNCSTQGDRVCDTPVTIMSSSCSTPACSGTQQVENYMDYTPETCQDMFTEGQKLRMRTTLETQRTSMTTSLGCMPVFTQDIGITQIISPTGTNCQGPITPRLTLTNFGSTTLTSATIMYNVDGIGSNTFNWTGSLIAGSSTTFDLTSITPSTGSHVFYAWTSGPNGSSDQNTTNDQRTSDFAISTGSPLIMDVVLDYYGMETTWVISDENNFEVLNGGPYVNGQQGLHNYTSVCLADGCYTLTMMDAYGDGQGFTNGSFSLEESDGTILASGAGNWGDFSNNPFCVTNAPAGGNAPIASFTIQDNTLCRNIQNDYTSTSTNSPTSYNWVFEGGSPATSTSENPQNITYANAGTYDVTLTATNSFGSHTYTCNNCVTVYNDPTITLTGVNPMCSGQNNGAVNTSVTGASPYSYSWNTGAASANLSNVGGGTYTVTVTDANTCTKQATATITSPAALAVTGTVTNAACSGINNGSITANASGGTGSKTYSWSNGASGATISNLASGSYTVTVLDANNCAATQSFNVTAPAGMTITGTTVHPTCNGVNNGSINAIATGGTGNKTYTWSNGSIGANISNLASGSYTVTVTDADGCSQTQTFTLTAPAGMTITATTTQPSCGINNGSITLNVTGGTGNKTYNWNNGATTSSLSNLPTGTYTVTVTDANGCSQSQTFALSAQASLSVTGSITAPTCFNSGNGMITAIATGGSGNINFSWSNGTNGSAITNATAGSYTVTATDAAGCTSSASFTVTAPQQMALNPSVSSLTCAGSPTGSISLNVTGGTGNKTYFWSTGATTSGISNLNAGNYSVVVTDQNGCNASQNFTVTSPAALNANLNDFDIACGDQFGSAQVTPSGGQSPYTILWSNGSVNTSILSLNAGTYSVQVTDNNGCMTSNNFDITESANLSVFANPTQVSCNGQNNGSIAINVSGGDQNYTYVWNNGSTASSLNGITAGNYSVVVTDGNGCNGSTNVTITQPAPITIVLDGEDVSCNGLNDGIVMASAYGGTSPYDFNWNNGQSGEYIDELQPDNYTVTVNDANGCTVQGIVSVEEPDMLVASIVIIAPESCTGNDGSAEVLVEGGTPGYFMVWSNGNTENILSEAATGSYSVAVTDGHGCLLNLSAEIPYDCDVAIPQTQLIPSDCNSSDVALNAVITCEEVPGASMYQWRFTTSTGIILSDEYSLGNMFYVSEIPGLTENTTYVIGIKALVSGNWSAFGDFCSITTINEPNNDIPELIAEDCGASIESWGTTLTSVDVPGAINYQWHITGENYDWMTYTENNTLTLEENMQLLPGETYAVQIRCALGNGNFTDWGVICEFTVEITIGLDDNTVIPGFLSIYPNPCDGERLYFDFGNLRQDLLVENVMLFGSGGNLIETFNINVESGFNRKHEHQFQNRIASGMYILTYQLNGQNRELKLLVK